MKVGSKEHYEMMAFFERTFKREGRMDKEDKDLWPKGYVYQHGEVNRLFSVFLHGVAFGKGEA